MGVGNKSTGRDVAGDGEEDSCGGRRPRFSASATVPAHAAVAGALRRRGLRRDCWTGGGVPSRRRVAVATVEKVFALYREKYFDLNVQHFHVAARRYTGWN